MRIILIHEYSIARFCPIVKKKIENFSEIFCPLGVPDLQERTGCDKMRREIPISPEEVRRLQTIAVIHTAFEEKFGIPRQSGLVDALRGEIVFERAFRQPEAVRGLEAYSHIWLIWRFSQAQRDGWTATVRPPRLGGNARVGVFATRSPFRPNAIGLSSVRLERVELDPARGPVLHVRGADLLDGTPILDIKPYLPFTDSHPDAACGFAAQTQGHALQVDFPPELLSRVPESDREALLGVLAQDPRPSYQADPTRAYGVAFSGRNVRFTVEDTRLKVFDVEPLPPRVGACEAARPEAAPKP